MKPAEQKPPGRPPIVLVLIMAAAMVVPAVIAFVISNAAMGFNRRLAENLRLPAAVAVLAGLAEFVLLTWGLVALENAIIRRAKLAEVLKRKFGGGKN